MAEGQLWRKSPWCTNWSISRLQSLSWQLKTFKRLSVSLSLPLSFSGLIAVMSLSQIGRALILTVTGADAADCSHHDLSVGQDSNRVPLVLKCVALPAVRHVLYFIIDFFISISLCLNTFSFLNIICHVAFHIFVSFCTCISFYPVTESVLPKQCYLFT